MMPSLRKRVAGFIRQLAVNPNQPDNTTIDSNKSAGASGCFIHRYLNGDETAGEEPTILHGRLPQELPRKTLGVFNVGPSSILAAVTGPDDGLTTVNKKQRHLSISDPDVDYIDILENQHAESDRITANASTDCIFSQSYGRWFTISRNPQSSKTQPIDNSVMHIRAAGSVFSVGPKSNANSRSDLFDLGLQHCKSSSHITDNERMRQLQDYHSLKVYESEDNLDAHVSGHELNVYGRLEQYGDGEVRVYGNVEVSSNDNGVRSASFSETTSRNPSNVKGSPERTADANSNAALATEDLLDNFARCGESPSPDEGLFNLATFDEDDFSLGEDFVIPPPAEYASAAPDNFTPLRKSKSAPSPFKNKKLTLCRQKIAESTSKVEEIAGVSDWKRPHDNAYGAATTLYEKSPVTGENAGNPIADCFALVARKDSAVLALADGVNWGEKASIAARSAVHGCVQHLDQALYSPAVPPVSNTTEVFVALLRSFHAAHSMILQEDGMLTTLTTAVVLPLTSADKYVVCVCNVGDSLAYVYSKKHGVREVTKGSHDIHCMRDMRDALGALGPVDGQNPELNNLTCSMTEIDAGDVVFLTSDGVSDNFDPVVGKFAVLPPHGSPTSLRPAHKPAPGVIEIHTRAPGNIFSSANSGRNMPGYANVTTFAPTNHTRNSPGPSNANKSPGGRRNNVSKPHSNINKGKVNMSDFSFTSSLPTVQAYQRHELSLLRMDDLLRHGVSGEGPPCDDARNLCDMLLDFATRLTAAKRHILEDVDLYLEPDETSDTGMKELSKAEQRSRRKKVLEKLQLVPGKLDHATVVAYKAGFGGGDGRETRL